MIDKMSPAQRFLSSFPVVKPCKERDVTPQKKRQKADSLVCAGHVCRTLDGPLHLQGRWGSPGCRFPVDIT